MLSFPSFNWWLFVAWPLKLCFLRVIKFSLFMHMEHKNALEDPLTRASDKWTHSQRNRLSKNKTKIILTEIRRFGVNRVHLFSASNRIYLQRPSGVVFLKFLKTTKQWISFSWKYSRVLGAKWLFRNAIFGSLNWARSIHPISNKRFSHALQVKLLEVF